MVRIYNGAVPVARVAQRTVASEGRFTLVYVGRLEPVRTCAAAERLSRRLWSMPGLRLWMVVRQRTIRLWRVWPTELGIDSQ